MVVNKGTLFWITGLSGSGKTSLAKNLYNNIREKNINTVFLDGDVLRSILGYKNNNYEKNSRLAVAMKYSNLSKLFTDQGINVIFATISMFDAVRSWNKKNIKNYVEIYLKVPLEKIIERDKNQLFSKAVKKENKNVVGIDITIEEPKNPDIILYNNEGSTIESLSKNLIEKINSILVANEEKK